MGRHQMIGRLEEAVLVALMRHHGETYGVPIQKAVSSSYGKDVSFSAVYTTLDRLEAKGFVSSRMGEATPERGGKAKKYFKIEAPGEHALKEAHARSASMWGGPLVGVST